MTNLTTNPESRSLIAKSVRRLGDDESRMDKLMVAMWQRMSDLFGTPWQTNYGGVNDPTIKTWGRGLADFTEDQLARGIKACENWAERFPPNLPQFKQLCLTVNRKREQENAKYLLPRKRAGADSEAAQAAFDVARKLGLMNAEPQETGDE